HRAYLPSAGPGTPVAGTFGQGPAPSDSAAVGIVAGMAGKIARSAALAAALAVALRSVETDPFRPAGFAERTERAALSGGRRAQRSGRDPLGLRQPGPRAFDQPGRDRTAQ